MPKAIKVGLIALAALAILLVGAGAIVAALFDPNDYKALIVERVRRDHQRTLAIPGRIGLSFFPRIGVEVGTVTLSEQRGSETFASLRSARMSLALWPLLHRQVVVDRIRVDGLQARLTRFADGRTSIDDLLGTPPAKSAVQAPAAGADSAPVQFEVGGVEIDDAAITLDDRAGGRRVELTKVEIATGRVATAVPTQASVKGHLKIDRPRIDGDVALEGTLLVEPARQRVALPKFSLRIGLVDGTRRIDARASGAIDADLKARTVALTGLEVESTLPNPDAGTLDLRAKGAASVKLDGPHVEATLGGKFDQSSFDAKLGMHGSPAVFSADVDVDRIDLDRYRSPAPAQPAPAAAAAAPIDLSALHDLNATATLRIGTLQAARMKASKLRVGLHAGGGRIDVAPMDAELYQGRLAGSASATTTAAPRFTIKQTLTGIAIGPLLKDALGRDRLEGRGNLVVDLSTQGGSASALQKALAGTARVELRDGALRGINIAQAIRNARAKAGGTRAAVAATAASTESTEFGELSASFAIAKGVAHNDDLVATSALLRIGGSGDIDLGEGRLDYVAKVTVVGSLPGGGGPELQLLHGKTVPVHLHGPFDAIGYRIDFGDLALETVKQQLGDRLKRLLGR